MNIKVFLLSRYVSNKLQILVLRSNVQNYAEPLRMSILLILLPFYIIKLVKPDALNVPQNFAHLTNCALASYEWYKTTYSLLTKGLKIMNDCVNSLIRVLNNIWRVPTS